MMGKRKNKKEGQKEGKKRNFWENMHTSEKENAQ